MDGLRHIIETAKGRLAVLTFNQKVLLGAVLTASVISVAIFSLWLQQEEMAVLFTGLGPEDAAAALEELAKQDVSTELANGGTTILVPAAQKDRLRLDLTTKGIPSSGTVGFEIFDGKQYGLTEFLQNVNFKRALEGELVKSIETLQGIQSARVHLVLPKPTIFQRESAQATASVVLRLGRQARLVDSQIAGIQSLVSGSVENLDTANVTVVDQHGKVLSAAVRDDDLGRSEDQLALRKEVEGHLAEKAASMLDKVLGPGRSIVRVDATLNFEKIDREREIYDPAATVVRSEARTESSTPEDGTSEQSETNYEINRTVERIVGQTGGISSLSVAVFVDGHYQPAAEGGEPVYQPLAEDELGQLRRIVQTAVGLNSVRGDQIEVVNMQFRQQEEYGTTGAPAGEWVGLATRHGGRVLLVIMLAAVALALRRNVARLLGDAFGPGPG
ncbi:MAG: flagellar M-ring protein FliF, partial [Krumholzibacteria bacterium]|nr:flagellar M-ring protein FliF [Candidatus Krumholzibacteria bacterium]